MKIIGIDFDNTIVTYGSIFYDIAKEKDLIEAKSTLSKTEVRDLLIKEGKEELFTYIQGLVYGPRIVDAEPSPGVIKKLIELKHKGYKLILVSHKTRYPIKGDKHDLHAACMNWLTKNGFFKSDGIGWGPEDLYFAETKEEKAVIVKEQACDLFIDDLPSMLDLIQEVSPKTSKLLYDPCNIHSSCSHKRLQSWKELEI